MDHYAVIGNPIAHSRSPDIHARFARQTGQVLRYDALLAPVDGFAQAVEAFRAGGGRGLNVTVPFKTEAFELCAVRSARAEYAGAVNTLWFDPSGRLHGDNTDGAGLVRDLEVNRGFRIESRHVLLLGAGGAALGVAGPLLDARAAGVTVANRTHARAAALVERLGGLRGGDTAGRLRAVPLDTLPPSRFDLVINATSASLAGELPAVSPRVLAGGAWCYDMMYADSATPFVRWGNEAGAHASVDGLGMLVEQAAESFELWRGVRPHTRDVIESIRARMRPA